MIFGVVQMPPTSSSASAAKTALAGDPRSPPVQPSGRLARLVHFRDQRLGIVPEVCVSHFHCVAADQPLYCVGQFVSLRHPCAIDQYRDDWDIAGERRRDFNRHVIVGVETATAAVVLRIGPIGPYHC